jgi:hypothetical protein
MTSTLCGDALACPETLPPVGRVVECEVTLIAKWTSHRTPFQKVEEGEVVKKRLVTVCGGNDGGVWERGWRLCVVMVM